MFVQLTVSPTLIVTVWGENAIPSMLHLHGRAPAASRLPPVVGVPLGAAVVVVLPLLHPTRTTAIATMASAHSRKDRPAERASGFRTSYE